MSDLPMIWEDRCPICGQSGLDGETGKYFCRHCQRYVGQVPGVGRLPDLRIGGKGDARLFQRFERLRNEMKAQRLSLQQPRLGCSCGFDGVCRHHAYAWNALLDAEQALLDGVRALQADAYQNGDGERPEWWEEEESDQSRDTLEELLRDVEIDLPGEGEGEP